MKLFRKISGLLLSLCLFCITVIPAMAAETADAANTVNTVSKTTYTVRLFPGEQGTIGNSGICEIICKQGTTHEGVFDANGGYVVEGLHYGDSVTFRPMDQGNASVKSSKYYIKGARISGRDIRDIKGNDAIGAPMPYFTVESDIDYIISYGILGDSVRYTVNYVDTDGNSLRNRDVYYGNVGDLAVVAYRYIEGYQPQAYNLGRTLRSDENENIFTFVYTPVGAGGAAGGGGTVTTITETEEAGGAGAGAAGAGGGAGAGGAAGANEAEAGAEIPDEEVPAGGPEDYINLDDENVPLANLEDIPVIGDFAVMLFNFSTTAKILILGGAAAGLGGIWYVAKRRKRKTESEG